MHVRSSSDVFTMEKKPNPAEAYYVLISYEPFDVRCKYKTLEAWCCVGVLTNHQVNIIERAFGRKLIDLTEPKCKEPTCVRAIYLLPERYATHRWFGARSPALNVPEEAIPEFRMFVGDQELGFEQCQALDNCINLVKEILIKSTNEGQDAVKVKSVTEQNIKVDLHRWESAATLEELSRVAGIEPTDEFDTDGWIAEYLEKIGFKSVFFFTSCFSTGN